MLTEGADMLDVGGYSSRPGATDISTKEELERIIPAIRSLKKQFPQTIISIDTFRAEVAEAALSEGAALVNDISGGEADANMFPLLGRWKVPYVLMHMRGNPQNMNSQTDYDDLVNNLIDYFSIKINKLRAIGVNDIVVDPGFGFAKNVKQNFVLLRRLADFRVLQLPILAGLSRKSLIWRTLHCSPEEALNGTTVLNTLAIQGGAGILRVHDVKAAAEVIELSMHYQEGSV